MEHKKLFVLRVIQPALVGLMDGSVSTIGPIFAAGVATNNPHVAFVVGLSASFGAAISMAFAEALSDTGEHTDRGHPVRRGFIVGGGTFIGGILHTLPFLIKNLHLALYLAVLIVGVELIAISFIRYHYFNIKFFKSAIQVILGGLLVLLSSFIFANI